MNRQSLIQLEPEIAPLLEGADYIDIKRVQGRLTMREFIAGLFTYRIFTIAALPINISALPRCYSHLFKRRGCNYLLAG